MKWELLTEITPSWRGIDHPPVKVLTEYSLSWMALEYAGRTQPYRFLVKFPRPMPITGVYIDRANPRCLQFRNGELNVKLQVVLVDWSNHA